MVILFIMAVYITRDHSDTFHILAEQVENEASGRGDLWIWCDRS